MNTPVYKDRIIKNLHKDSVRDKVLSGELKREDADNENVYEFLTLLALEKKDIQTKSFDPITLEDWKIVVKKAKK